MQKQSSLFVLNYQVKIKGTVVKQFKYWTIVWRKWGLTWCQPGNGFVLVQSLCWNLG